MTTKQTAISIVLGVAMTLGLSVSASAGATQLLKTSRHVPSAADIFPTVSNPHLYRQSLLVACGGDGTCILKFDKVGANQLLEIDSITCATNGTETFLLRDPVLDANHIIAALQLGTGTVPGPFYVAAGERPTIDADGSANVFCSIYGTLWTTG